MNSETEKKYFNLINSFERKHVCKFGETFFDQGYKQISCMPKYLINIESIPKIDDYKFVMELKNSKFEEVYKSKYPVKLWVKDTDKEVDLKDFGYPEIKFVKMNNGKRFPVSFVKFGFEEKMKIEFSNIEIPEQRAKEIITKLTSVFTDRHVREPRNYSKEFYKNLYNTNEVLPNFITSVENVPKFEDFDLISVDPKSIKLKYKMISKKKILCDICSTQQTNENSNKFKIFRGYFFIEVYFNDLNGKKVPVHFSEFKS